MAGDGEWKAAWRAAGRAGGGGTLTRLVSSKRAAPQRHEVLLKQKRDFQAVHQGVHRHQLLRAVLDTLDRACRSQGGSAGPQPASPSAALAAARQPPPGERVLLRAHCPRTCGFGVHGCGGTPCVLDHAARTVGAQQLQHVVVVLDGQGSRCCHGLQAPPRD